jgi:hypothetical protein
MDRSSVEAIPHRSVELGAAIADLTERNRRAEDAELERELLRLRHERFLALDNTLAPAESPPRRMSPVSIDPEVGLPAVEGPIDAGLLRSTLEEHGSLVVRKLVSGDAVLGLRDAVQRALAARDRIVAASAEPDDTDWYHEFVPPPHGPSRGFTSSAGMLAVDSPRGAFRMLEAFREAGLGRLAADFLGAPAAMSAEKTVFRRVDPGPFTSWHQDGAFLGETIRTLDVWIALSHCGRSAPSLEILPRRVPRVLPTGGFFSWDLDEREIERAYPGYTTVLAQFEPGDAILFDQLCVHRSGHAAGMTEPRLAIECWLFACGNVPDDYTGLAL